MFSNPNTVIHQESTSWWQHQAKDLSALTEESEMGMMQAMVTTVEGSFAHGAKRFVTNLKEYSWLNIQRLLTRDACQCQARTF